MTDCNGAFKNGVISSWMSLSFTIRSLLFSISVVLDDDESVKTQIVSAVKTAVEMAMERQTLTAVAN